MRPSGSWLILCSLPGVFNPLLPYIWPWDAIFGYHIVHCAAPGLHLHRPQCNCLSRLSHSTSGWPFPISPIFRSVSPQGTVKDAIRDASYSNLLEGPWLKRILTRKPWRPWISCPRMNQEGDFGPTSTKSTQQCWATHEKSHIMVGSGGLTHCHRE
jgi:hypothetical protein